MEGVAVDFGRLRALDDVRLELERGSSLALIGANGSGKSTLLNLLAGLTPPSQGSLWPQPLPSVAYVRQHGPEGSWLPLTAGEVLRMGRYRSTGWWGRITDSDRAMMAEVAERMAVGPLLHRSFDELSGGERQRVMIAQALAQQAPVLLLDEPITGLDLPSQERILQMIEDETASGTAVVVSTHHLDEARHCDRVALLARRLVAVGRPDEVLTPELLRETYGPRLLGDHTGHDHETELLVLDEHGHDHGEHGHPGHGHDH
jgi:ABC-type Mn2+/Zn2+ transport system ATPase subunit